MLRYIVRLDDATPKMNKEGWDKVEAVLDKYGVQPIVGIIPDSQDSLFKWDDDPFFWTETVERWKNKGWTIAQHGCHHVYHECGNGIHSEFIGLSYERQKQLIDYGYELLVKQNIRPVCFFAPGHTFDETTVDVCRDSGYFEFISDGYAVYPYSERNMLFFPSIFDTAHKVLPFGIYTFILHPSFTTEQELKHLDDFISRNIESFRPVPEIMKCINKKRKKNVFELLIEPTISIMRKVRRMIQKL